GDRALGQLSLFRAVLETHRGPRRNFRGRRHRGSRRPSHRPSHRPSPKTAPRSGGSGAPSISAPDDPPIEAPANVSRQLLVSGAESGPHRDDGAGQAHQPASEVSAHRSRTRPGALPEHETGEDVTERARSERKTQNRVVALFTDPA